jgi:hypothetical protein
MPTVASASADCAICQLSGWPDTWRRGEARTVPPSTSE